MIRALIRPYTVALAAGVLALTSACTMKSQEPPPLAGPSEFDLSISLAASPDQLQQDGASQSLITVTARDANSAPARNLTLRAAMSVQGTLMDFGSLSARNIVTGSDGRATVVYTAPPSAAIATDPFTIVDIVVTPSGSDFSNTTSRLVSIRLYPQGIVVPGQDLEPAFTVDPTGPSENQTVLFDASTSKGSIAIYDWRFGDGGRASGPRATHAYTRADTYVATLTVTDPYGRTASASKSITVGAGVNPTAAFDFSPTAPLPLQQIFFNASASRGAPGRTIVSYAWDFGDGSTGSGPTPTHSYATAAGYRVTLVVTDDAGRTGVVTQNVTIGDDSPKAAFDFAPATPAPNQSIAFNGSTSTAVTGRTIVSYTWNWGDGTPAGSGIAPNHSYPTAGTRNVTLTVVDNAGKSGSITKPVTVQ